jgi:hypothetical protein
LALSIANFVVTFGSDGRIDSQGSISDITERSSLGVQLSIDQFLDKTQQEIDDQDPAAKPADGKLIAAEEIQLGHVGASSCSSFTASFYRSLN